MVPANIANEVSCWGEPRTEEEYWLQSPYLECSIKDNLYISSTVMAHGVSYNYSWVKSRGYNPFRFYTLTNQAFIKQYRFDLDNAGERDVENFVCRTDIVNIASTPFWVSTCGRKLKKLPKLYDVNIRMASLGQMDRMMMIEVTLGAVTKKTAKSFINKFYQELEWTKSSSK